MNTTKKLGNPYDSRLDEWGFLQLIQNVQSQLLDEVYDSYPINEEERETRTKIMTLTTFGMNNLMKVVLSEESQRFFILLALLFEYRLQ